MTDPDFRVGLLFGIACGMTLMSILFLCFGPPPEVVDCAIVNKATIVTRIEWDGRTWIPEEKPDE